MGQDSYNNVMIILPMKVIDVFDVFNNYKLCQGNFLPW